ncbi:MAG: ATP-binding cassette domain-containing protein, partial [Bacteroidota bacterium]|nr:ATP-binding cassette domain-containing protein [Bacteroidota bacterium]
MIQNLLRVEKFIESPTEKLQVKKISLNGDKVDAENIFTKHKPHISVRNLNVYLTKNHILKNVSLDIPDKAITCIIGPSGCGKTTLLKTFNR